MDPGGLVIKFERFKVCDGEGPLSKVCYYLFSLAEGSQEWKVWRRWNDLKKVRLLFAAWVAYCSAVCIATCMKPRV